MKLLIRFNLAFILISSQGKEAFGAGEPYYAGEKGGVCNHVNDVIRSEAQCRDALQNLGYENLPSFWTGEYSEIPSGCSISHFDSQPYFETSTTGLGMGMEDQTPICVKFPEFEDCYALLKKDYDDYGNLQLSYALVLPTLNCFQKHIETILNIFKMNNLKINDLD